MWTPVALSPDAATSFEPMPRIEKFDPVKLPFEKFTLGMASTRFGPPSIFCFCS